MPPRTEKAACSSATWRKLPGQHAGRDHALPARVDWWVVRFGDRITDEITDDDVFAALEELATTPAMTYAGRTRRKPDSARPRLPSAGDAQPLPRRAKRPLPVRDPKAPRPEGMAEPRPTGAPWEGEHGRVRYLSDDERHRLLAVCRTSTWAKLHLIVRMALTTGARKGELLALRWGDLELRASRRARTSGGRRTASRACCRSWPTWSTS